MKASSVCSQFMEDGVFTAKEEKERRLVAIRRSCRVVEGRS